MAKKKEEKKEQTFVLTSTKHTKVNFKSLDKKLMTAIIAGKDFWMTTTSQIQIKQETAPIPMNDGIDIVVSLHNPSETKKPTKKNKNGK